MAEHNPSTVEEWRPVAGCDGRYEVSSLGRVRSLYNAGYRYRILRAAPLVLSLGLKGGGYHQVSLGTSKQHVKVANLVLETFVGPRPQGCDSAHQDGNRLNDAAANLRWMTRSENCQQKRLHGTWQAGERHGIHKLTSEDVRHIRRVGRSVTYQTMAMRFGVSIHTIARVLKGESYQSVGAEGASR